MWCAGCWATALHAANATREAYFGQGVGPVWLDEVLCSGGEQSLLECSHSEVGAHDCRHSEDAGVICSSEYLCLLGGGSRGDTSISLFVH